MDIELFEKLCNAFGPSGHETDVQQLFKEYGEKYADEVLIDRLGSVILRKGSSGPKIMMAGHGDEIGFVIRKIEDNGYLRFHNLGGWWPGNVISHQVAIRPFGGGEEVIGIVVNKPPHILPASEREKVSPLKDLMIDVGCSSKKEVEALGIRVGDASVPYAKFRTMKRIKITKNDDGEEESKERTLVVSKALDNRLGIFVVLEALKRVKEQNIDHQNSLYFVSTVQEEVGVRGAKTASNLVKPDIGIALDVDISGDIPGINLIQKMGDGVSISAGDSMMIPHPKLRKFVIETADKAKIKWQDAFLPAGGTDAAAMHVTGIGAPSVFLGVPTRHIHSHAGMLDLDDVEQAIQLLVEVIKTLDTNVSVSFTAL